MWNEGKHISCGRQKDFQTRWVASAQLPSSSLEKQCESDCTSSLGILYAKIEAKLKQTKQNKISFR